MDRIVMASVTLLLAACQTPQSLQNEGARTEYLLLKPPAIAAACLARNAEGDRDWFSVTIRPLEAPDRLELILRVRPDSASVLAHVLPKGDGSRATIYMRREWFYRRDELLSAMIAGC